MGRKQRKSRVGKQRQEMEWKAAHEIQETTMQMPFGYGSLFYAAEQGLLPAAACMTVALSMLQSNWDSGKSHIKSYRDIAKALGISKSYVRKLIKRTDAWLKKVKTTSRGTLYQVSSHVYAEDTPEDRKPIGEDGKPLKFALPIGKGGPFDRLLAGDISWQTCWLWIVMKRNSYWDGNDEKAGQTFPLSYDTLVAKTGMSRGKVASALKALKAAGMVERLSLAHETGVYQLYPKPPKTAVKRKSQRYQSDEVRVMDVDATHIYSLNYQYRIEIDTGQFELSRRKRWVSANRDQVPEHIRIEMEEMNMQINAARRGYAEARRGFRERRSNSDTGGANGDTPRSYYDTPETLREAEATSGMPF